MASTSNTTENSADGSVESVSQMALYSLSRIEAGLAALADKPKWSLADTAAFDSMHYDTDASLETCARRLNLQPGQHILDVGSGFSSTGRYLATKHGAHVTGIELQAPVHALAQRITARNENEHVTSAVRSLNADFLTLDRGALVAAGAPGVVDHLVSFLCIVHMPKEARPAMFAQAARFVRPGGFVYVEDFYNPTDRPLGDEDRRLERDVIMCTYSPTRAEYVAVLEGAGFTDVQFEDVSAQWTPIVVKRAAEYKAGADKDADLEYFYDTVAGLFSRGAVGGVRLRATRL